MTLLTDKQREEVVEAAFDALWPLQNWEMDPNVCRAAAMAALTAALPAIERAVLERAAEAAVPAAVPLEWMEDPNWPHILEGMRRSREIVRALAGEVG